ncbi:DUF1573 domain-containing protein [Stieleria sp. ICT_E10.1]|uniref:DUF1573 domain-containing protein n=1 Tax=Stieleria sedimenti TaxID=2976331 RepID=UPI00217F2943|nr:DUF1573 domain-containing protein [Stieleria sedimenti]MCS7470354.1 DUF1573 domain-containing protein [Stieleria sedimenti]
MNQFTKRLLVFGGLVLGFASFALALTQVVSYKPWGVPDSRRDDYDQRVAELDRQAILRETYQNKPRPSAKAWPAVHDFGWVRPGEAVRHTAEIENVGNAELNLRIRETSLERLTAQLEHERLAPGESTQCTIELVTSNQPSAGLFEGRVTIATNDPLNRTLVLSVLGRQKTELVLPTAIDFGSHDMGEASTVDFVIYSQLAQHLNVVDVSNPAFDLQWVAVSEPIDDQTLGGMSATAASRITVEMEAKDYGHYSDQLELTVEIDGQEKQCKLDFGGRVRPPIGFYGPNVDRRTGVDFGTVENDEQHDLFVVVRSRADRSRKIAVLDMEPKELQAELQPLESEGSYRLRISIPKDCPYRRFNLAEQHGYIQIGDPEMKSYSNWLPVYGVVGDFDAD